jgi:UDP-glucose 4-epimerase
VKRFTLRHPAGGAHDVLLFGSGILGGAIAARLGAQAPVPPVDLSWPWGDAQARLQTAGSLQAQLLSQGPAAISLVWAAGRSGMGSTEADMQRETALVGELVDLARAFATRDGLPVHVHLISSAGGLFDGRTHVGADTVPTPERPYGLGKLAQEQMLTDAAAAAPGLSAHIYRPTTVYGFQAGARMGLIPVLILNGLAGRTSTIIGRADTIRDYVATEDVARFLAGRVLQLAPPPPAPLLLASGRPAPLGEIVAETESLLGTRLYLRYDPRPSNSANMSFRPSAIPAGLQPVDIRSGIRRVAQAVRAHAFRLQNG